MISFDFSTSDLLYSNLGGLGPDTSAPKAIRFVGAGSATYMDPITQVLKLIRFDLVLTNTSTYRTSQSSLNGIVDPAT